MPVGDDHLQREKLGWLGKHIVYVYLGDAVINFCRIRAERRQVAGFRHIAY